MAVKSILDIDVNDEKFKRFSEQFQKYRAALDAMPAKWGKINKTTTQAQDMMAGMAAYGVTFGEQLNKNTKTLEQHDSLWKKIATHTRNIKNDILSISKWIIGGTIGLGIAGLFGLTALARSVSGQRTASLTSGTRFGDVQAFTKNLGRNMPGAAPFISQAFLSSTPGSAQFTAGKIFGVDTSLPPLQFAEALYLAIQSRAKNVGAGRFMQMFQKIISPLGLGTGDIESMVMTSGAETQREIAATNRTARQLNLPNATAEASQNFLSSLNAAFTTMGNQMFSALTPLLKPLEHLMNGIVKVVREIVNSGAASKFIDDLASGIQKFASYVSSGEFTAGLNGFLVKMLAVAKFIEKVGSGAEHAAGWTVEFGKSLGWAWAQIQSGNIGVSLNGHVLRELPSDARAAAQAEANNDLAMLRAHNQLLRNFRVIPGAAGTRSVIPALPPLHINHFLQIHVEPGSTIIADLNTLAPLPQWAGA